MFRISFAHARIAKERRTNARIQRKCKRTKNANHRKTTGPYTKQQCHELEIVTTKIVGLRTMQRNTSDVQHHKGVLISSIVIFCFLHSFAVLASFCIFVSFFAFSQFSAGACQFPPPLQGRPQYWHRWPKETEVLENI